VGGHDEGQNQVHDDLGIDVASDGSLSLSPADSLDPDGVVRDPLLVVQERTGAVVAGFREQQTDEGRMPSVEVDHGRHIRTEIVGRERFGFDDLAHGVVECRGEELLLVAEVVVQALFVGLGRLGDTGDASSANAVAGELLGRGVQDPQLDRFFSHSPNHKVGMIRPTVWLGRGPMVSIDCQVRAGDLGAIVEQHGRLYRAEYHLDERFEAYVAAGVGAAVLSEASPPARFWVVRDGEELLGSAAVCPASERAGQFRWFLLDPRVRGQGVGRQLLDKALEHSRAVRYQAVFLWTFDALEAAARLYRSAGFVETERLPEASPWGVPVTEVRYDLTQSFRFRRQL
jgi:GNAT superfamily N-acetyltransferase